MKKYFEISLKRKMMSRILAMAIDSLTIIFFIIFITIFAGQKILISMLYSAIVALCVNMFSIFLFPKNGSLGMLITKIAICDFYGGQPSTVKLIKRQLLVTLYWVPFINGMLILTNIVSILIYKDKYIHDFLTKTMVDGISSVMYNERS